MTDRIVTVTATIMDGTVVRWYGSLRAAENHREIISASRNGVMGGDTYITPADFAAAWSAHEELVRYPYADMRHLATHRAVGCLVEPLEPLAPVSE